MALNPKAIGAAGIAAAAVGVAAWQIASFTGIGAEVVSAKQAAQAASPTTPTPIQGPTASASDDSAPDSPNPPISASAPPQGARMVPFDPLAADPAQTFRFQPPTDLGDLTSDLTYVADGTPELATLGRAGKASMVDTWRAFVTPLVAGDRDRFTGAASRAGAEPQAAAKLFDRLQPAIQDAEFDLSKAITRAIDPTDATALPRMPQIPASFALPGGTTKAVSIPMMMSTNQSTDRKTGQTVRDKTLGIPLTGIFDRAGTLLNAQAPLVEVWTPARLADRRTDTADLGMSVFMAHDRSANTWVPAAFRLKLVSDHAQQSFTQALSASRSTPEQAAGDTP
ncbi:MAG: hypothetical protein AAF297_12090 [Planctomycetota bacterium]